MRDALLASTATGGKQQQHCEEEDVTSSSGKGRSRQEGENLKSTPMANDEEEDDDGENEETKLMVDPSLPAYTDVLVIGAGPAGLMIAHELARHEIDVVILDHSRIEFDPAEVPPEMSCPSQAALLQASTLDVLEDVGLINDVVAESRAIQKATILLDGKPKLQVDRFEESKSTRFQSGLIYEQWKLEKMLCDKLGRQYATRVFRHHVAYRLVIKLDGDQSTSQESQTTAQGKTATGFVGDPSEYRVKALVKRINPLARRVVPDHEGKWIRAKWVVGADGVRSMTRRALETGSVPMGDLTEYLVADVVIAEWDKESFFAKLNPGGSSARPDDSSTPYGAVGGSEGNSIFIIHCDLGSAMAFQFAADNHWRLMLLRPPAEDIQGDLNLRLDPGLNGFRKLDPPQDEEVADILRQLIPGTVVSEVKWKVAYAVQPRLAAALVKERGIIIGDAVRQEGPLWSAGLNAAIHDAVSLGWRLAAVIHRWGKYELLEAFSEERHAISEALMRWSIEHRDPLLSYSKVIQSNSLLQPVMSEKRLVQSLRSVVMVPEVIDRMLSSMDVGLAVGACRVLAFSANEDAPPKVLPSRFFVRDGCHALFLMVRVLPLGTKQRTVFGCERNEPAARWNEADVLKVSHLAKETVKKLGVYHSGAFNKRPGVKVVWTLCLVTDAKDAGSQSLMPNAAYVKQVPQSLKEFIQSNNVLTTPTYTIIDHSNEIQQRSGVSFISKPQWITDVYRQLCGEVAAYVQDSNQTAAFLLMRPDGRVAAMGYPGKAPGADSLDDYLESFIPVDQ